MQHSHRSETLCVSFRWCRLQLRVRHLRDRWRACFTCSAVVQVGLGDRALTTDVACIALISAIREARRSW